nr:tyrosine-type recombinase/integrase [uncultured Clostridium sp.]
MVRNDDTKIKYFTQQETKRLFEAIEGFKSIHIIRDLAIFRVAYRCGLRASEIALITLQDYNKIKGEIYCKRLKGSKNNTIRLDDKTKFVLDKYIEDSNIIIDNEPIFKSQKNNPISRQTLDYLIKKYCEIANISDKSKYHFHAIKHTTAVHLAESDMDIKELQWWLGHKSVTNTEIYFQFTTKQQERMYLKLSHKSEMV